MTAKVKCTAITINTSFRSGLKKAMSEPLLFSDSEGDVDSDGDDFMLDKSEITDERASRILEEMLWFLKADGFPGPKIENMPGGTNERGSQIQRLKDYILSLNLDPPVSEDEWYSEKVQKLLRRDKPYWMKKWKNKKSTKKENKEFTKLYFGDDEVVPGTPPQNLMMPIAIVDDDDNDSSSYYVSESSESDYVSDTDDEVLEKQSLNLLDSQRSPLKTYAWNEGFSLSQANVVKEQKENYEPIDFDDEDFDSNLLTQTPKRKGHRLPELPTLISQRSHNANFIATPLGWSLLELPLRS